jgi:hypothetical protein
MEFRVRGMTCAHCEAAVARAAADPAAIRQAIKGEGYEVEAPA